MDFIIHKLLKPTINICGPRIFSLVLQPSGAFLSLSQYRFPSFPLVPSDC